MFELFGLFSEKEKITLERFLSCLTSFSVEGGYSGDSTKHYKGAVLDFSQNFYNFKQNYNTLKTYNKNVIVILPPFYKVAEFYAKFSEKIIIKFCGERKFYTPVHPYVTEEELRCVLNEFSPFKEKCLIMLSGSSFEYDMLSHQKTVLTNNQAVLKALVHSSSIYYDKISQNSYFTYKNENRRPKFVWVEDTKSLSFKHNLIKNSGFCGICWESPYIMSEGNWETLYSAYNKANKKENCE